MEIEIWSPLLPRGAEQVLFASLRVCWLVWVSIRHHALLFSAYAALLPQKRLISVESTERDAALIQDIL